MIRVLLADDHALVRAGFRALLSTLPGVKVVAEAATGNEALALARRHPVDIALLDIGMPGLSGLDALTEMRREFPKIRVIILSMHVNEDYLRRALHDGASGYVLKDATVAELDTAIRAASRNVRYVSPGIAQVLTEAPTAAPAASVRAGAPGTSHPTPPGDPGTHRRGQYEQGDRGQARHQPEDRGRPPHGAHGAAGHP